MGVACLVHSCSLVASPHRLRRVRGELHDSYPSVAVASALVQSSSQDVGDRQECLSPPSDGNEHLTYLCRSQTANRNPGGAFGGRLHVHHPSTC